MTSNIFSRFNPAARGRSFYEELRAKDGDELSDVEDTAALRLDQDNLNQYFHDNDLEHAKGLALDDSRGGLEGATTGTRETGSLPRVVGHAAQRWAGMDDDADNNVPESLLVEPRDVNTSAKNTSGGNDPATMPSIISPFSSPPIAGPSTRHTRAQWEATQEHQGLYDDEVPRKVTQSVNQPRSLSNAIARVNAEEQALWRWINVSNLDYFMRDVYDYYREQGVWCIITARVLHLVNLTFIAVFLTFLTQCIDFGKVRGSHKLEQILIPQCTKKMPWYWNVGLWFYAFYFIWKVVQHLVDLRRLFHLRDFYVHLLRVPEHDMQTVTWQDIVARIMSLRDLHPKTAAKTTQAQRQWMGAQSKERLDAHDIANRLMRKENYLIALVNKDILNLSLPLPFLRNKQLLTRTLHWNLNFGVLDFIFDETGQVRQEFLRPSRRAQLSLKLKSRFLFAGFMGLLLAPFVACYLIIVYFLTYYNEYQKNPSALSARSYTPLAEWKFREFNELEHMFTRRLNMSHPFASRYIEQFPKAKTAQLATTVAFVAGSIVTVLAIASVVDPEMFLNFEITPDRTVLFYLGVFGTIWAFARGAMSDETTVFDPEYALRNVIDYTRFQPDHWTGRLHSFDVKQEFAELYKLKIVIFLEEILGILLTPLVLFLSLPNSSDQIIDFFREFTVHVDGLGYVCSFAVFDFEKGVGNRKQTSEAADVRDEYYSTKHGKMAASYFGFIDNYVINPRTGIPGHQPPGGKHQFHPPPAFPGLGSPTLGADLQQSRMGQRERGRRGPSASGQLSRTTRLGAGGMPMSPMASVLLDPHHQPSAPTLNAARSMHRPRTRWGHPGESDILEEPAEGILEESTWQTSPPKTISRENSGAESEQADVGVLGLMYQFQQAHTKHNKVGGGPL